MLTYVIFIIKIKARDKMKHYGIQKNWKKLKPFFNTDDVQKQIVKELISSQYSNCMDYGLDFKLKNTDFQNWKPCQFESSDWLYNLGRRGRRPDYFKFVKSMWCHWSVNVSMVALKEADPKTPWRIVVSDEHSTIWDGESTLFDILFEAKELDASEAWSLATSDGFEELNPFELSETDRVFDAIMEMTEEEINSLVAFGGVLVLFNELGLQS
jgi:hypothetical protein